MAKKEIITAQHYWGYWGRAFRPYWGRTFGAYWGARGAVGWGNSEGCQGATINGMRSRWSLNGIEWHALVALAEWQAPYAVVVSLTGPY